MIRRQFVSANAGWLVVTCLVLGGGSQIFAQAPVVRPPSRVLEDGAINHWQRPKWRLTESASAPADVEHIPTVPPIDTSIMEASAEWPVRENVTLPVEIEPPVCGWNVPNMFGDFFGAGTELLTIRGNQLLNASATDVFPQGSLGTGANNRFLVVSPANSVLGRQKAANNNSPLPRNRVALDYHYLSNTSLQDGGVGAHRFTFGGERTFRDGLISAEVRLPVGITSDSDTVVTGGSSRDQAELGNLYLAAKAILCSTDSTLFSGGLGASIPTANDLRFSNANGRELIRVENDSFHLLPFVAGAWSDGGWFSQGFLQLDFDLNGNAVNIDDGSTRLRKAGTFSDATFLYLDWGAGYWLVKNRQASSLTGIAPTLELHYNTALGDTETVRSTVSGIQFGSGQNQVESVVVLIGSTFEFASRHTLALGYATPIGGGDDEAFDGAFLAQLNWYFGGQ